MIAGLEAAELVITQDAFRDTETNRYADIVLPAALWAESDGVMVNSERNLTLLAAVDARPRESPPGLAADRQVAAHGLRRAVRLRVQRGDLRRDPALLEPDDRLRPARRQLRAAAPDTVQWPCPPDDDATATRSATSTTASARSCFVDADGTRRGWRSRPRRGARSSTPGRTWMPRELPDDDYPFVLNTGRLQHQWHTMTKTGKVAKLNKLDPGPFVEIHPVDAAALGIVDGQPVEIASRRGRAVLPAVVTDRVRPGNCFAPFHWNDVYGEYLAVNAVTNDAVDPDSFQPEFKVCAVSAAARSAVPVREAKPLSRPDLSRRTTGAVGVADRHRRGVRRAGWPPASARRTW